MSAITVALIGAAAVGIGSAMTASGNAKAGKDTAKAMLEAEKIKGAEQRKTALYSALLGLNVDQKAKFNKAQGLANYTAFSKTQAPSRFGSLNAMMNFNSPNQIKDPGPLPGLDDKGNFTVPGVTAAPTALNPQTQKETQPQAKKKGGFGTHGTGYKVLHKVFG